MLVDYGIQVTTNYLQRRPGEDWKDIWFRKIDFVDVAVSGMVSGATVGLGHLCKTGEITKTMFRVGKVIVNFGLTAVSAVVNYTPSDKWSITKSDEFLIEYGFNTLIKTNIASKYSDDAVDALFGDKPWKYANFMELFRQIADIPASIFFNTLGRSASEKYWEKPKGNNISPISPIVVPTKK